MKKFEAISLVVYENFLGWKVGLVCYIVVDWLGIRVVSFELFWDCVELLNICVKVVYC